MLPAGEGRNADGKPLGGYGIRPYGSKTAKTCERRAGIDNPQSAKLTAPFKRSLETLGRMDVEAAGR